MAPRIHREAVLVLGNSGSGKTTVTQIIAGNLTKVHSVLSSSGKMIIVDDDQKIGYATLASKTLIPELVVDKLSGTAFYDCPGFNDNRGPEPDISANFFMKKVTDHLEKLKLLFVIPFPSLQETRAAHLDRLARNAARFVRRIGNLGNGMALLVTMIPGNAPPGFELSDEETRSEIRNYLEHYAELQKVKLNTTVENNERVTIEGAIHFVKNIIPNNIGFVRDPRKCSALSKNENMLKTRDMLSKLVSSIQFVSKNEVGGFGYSLSERTAARVTQLAGEEGNRIAIEMKRFVKSMETWEQGEISRMLELREKADFYGKRYGNYNKLLDVVARDTGKYSKPGNLSNEVLKQLNVAKHTDPSPFHKLSDKLTKAGELLDFFEEMTNNLGFQILRDTRLWISPIQRYTHSTLRFKSSWYPFLLLVDKELGTYRKQKGKRNYKTPQEGGEMGFLRALGIHVPGELLESGAEGTYLSELEKGALRQIIISAMESSNVSCSVDGNRLFVKGNYVKVSEFVGGQGAIQKTGCPKIQFLHVEARRKIFMDMDVKEQGMGLQVSFISPTLEVTGKDEMVINLDGLNGAVIEPRSGSVCTSKGAGDGKPGNPGGPGGSFFGIFRVIEGEAPFNITANGGWGSAGQDGYPGCDGHDGSDANGRWITRKDKFIGEWKGIDYGEDGSKGQDGGDGGAGGAGGFPGKITIHPTTNRITTSQECGHARIRNGANGEGGVGGIGGWAGQTVYCSCDQFIFIFKSCKCEEYSTRRIQAPGRSGINGGNRKGQNMPHKLKEAEPWKSINEYKAFALALQSSESLLPFLEILDDKAVAVRPPKAFCHELSLYQTQLLTTQVVPANANPVFLAYYNTLPTRLQKYAAQSQYTLSNQDKLILSHVYTTVMSSMGFISTGETTSMVVNVQEYISLQQNKLKELQERKAMGIVQQQMANVRKGFERKISQCLEFISSTVQPTLSSIEQEMDDTTQALLRRVAEDTRKAEYSLTAAKELQLEMDSAMRERLIFSSLRIIGQTIASLTGFGAFGGGAVGNPLPTIVPLLVGDVSTVKQQTALPPSIKAHASQMESELQLRKRSWLNSLQDLLALFKGNIMQKGPKELRDLESSVMDFERQIAGLRRFSGAVEEDPQIVEQQRDLLNKIENTRMRLKERLHKQIPKEQNKEKREKEERDAKNALFFLDSFQTAIKFGHSAEEVYRSMQNDTGRLEVLSQGVAKAEAHLRGLQAYRESIYNAMIPDIKNMSVELGKISNSFSRQSIVSLQVSKWNIKSKLKDFRLRLKRMVEGENLQEKFVLFVEQLDEGMTMLINLYEFIEGYQEQAELAQLMANINQAKVPNTVIQDPETKECLTKLDVSLRTQSFLKEYKTAVNAVKQWVFPFAKLYLRDLELPKNFTTGISAETAAIILGGQISKLQRNIGEYKSVILRGQDNFLRYTTFSSKFVSSHPFYVWRGEEWPTALGQLLAGKQVYLVADINYAATRGKGAVKFTVAELTLTARNRDNQTFVDDKMKSFGVLITHSGISHYSLKESRYFMVGENQTYGYNYEVDEKGDRLNPTSVYMKFKNGDYLLSPYTTWTVQLVKAKDKAEFGDLKGLKDMVDLELSGVGSYVDEKLMFSKAEDELDLDQYYEREF